MENVATTETITTEYKKLADYEAEVLIDYFKATVKDERLDKSEMEGMLNDMLVNFLINDESGNKYDKIAHKKLTDICLVMVHHLDKIMQLQKQHGLYED